MENKDDVTKITREFIDKFLSAKTEQECLSMIRDLNESELRKFNYVLEIRLRNEVIEHFSSDLDVSFRSIRETLEKDPTFSAYKN